MLPALPAIWLLLPQGLGPHAGLEEWMQAAKPVATAAATCIVIVVALPAIIGVFMLLGGNIAMAMRRRYDGISKSHIQSISSANFPLLHDTDSDTATPRESTRSSADFLSIDGNRAHLASHGTVTSRTTTSINDQLIDLKLGKPPCVCVCCARAGCCAMFATAGILLFNACVW